MCRICIGDVEHRSLRSMPGTSSRGFYSLIREPSVKALKALGIHSEEIYARWQREAGRLGIDSQDFLGQSQLDFARLSVKLRKTSFPAFQRQVRELGGALAQCGIPLNRSIDAINRLFELCIPHLINHEPEAAGHILALSRLQSLMILLIISNQDEPDVSR